MSVRACCVEGWIRVYVCVACQRCGCCVSAIVSLLPARPNEGGFGEVNHVALLSLVREERTLREVAVVGQKVPLIGGGE